MFWLGFANVMAFFWNVTMAVINYRAGSLLWFGVSVFFAGYLTGWWILVYLNYRRDKRRMDAELSIWVREMKRIETELRNEINRL